MAYTPARPVVDRVLLTPVRENGLDEWTRFEGASVAIGHYVRMAHTGRLTPAEGWEGVCEYNAAQLRPPWPLDRLRSEYDRLTLRHEQQYGPAKTPRIDPVPVPVAIHRLGDLLDDDSPIPDDLISPRVLTPEGMLVLAGAPKVGKSDLLIHLLVHAAAGEPFLVFTFPRPLRIFYLHAEIDYHYLRERLQTSGIDPGVLQRARQNLVMTSKLRMLLDESGVDRIAAIISEQFGDQPPDIICIDPIRNLFDGGIYEGGENANAAMLFFLQQRVEILRAEVAPGAGLTLIHHTRKSTKEQLQDDPFQAISGASSLRSYYTSGVLMHRPDESQPQRQLEIELRNGPGLEPIQIVKHGGQWVVVDQRKQRITQRESGRKWDAERDRRRDVIVDLIESEGREGRLYTTNQFAERFEGQSDLGGKDTVRNRIGVLATKGWIKFTRAVAGATLPPTTSRWGYLCVEHMQIPGDDEKVDPTTGEVTKGMVTVLPAQYKCPQTGTAQPVENPMVWVYHDDLAPLE